MNLNYRKPKESDWRVMWEEALSNQMCSQSSLTCILHFSSGDYSLKGRRHILKKMAVPTIFNEKANDTTNNLETTLETTLPNDVGVENQNEMLLTKIMNLEKELNDLKEKCQEPLVRFAMEANDATVSISPL